MKHGFGHFCPKAVLFDMDGVIYDSMPNHAQSWHQAMADFGLDMEPSEAYTFEGMRGVETIQQLASRQWGHRLSDERAQEIYRHKTELFAACPSAPMMNGTEQLMRQIKDCGLKICVVTGSAQHVLLDKLIHDYKGLVSDQLLVTAFDVKRGKPAPDPYIKGLLKCGVEPWEAIVVENAPLGVRAAVAAHILTIAVNTGPLPDRMLSDEGASIVFDSMVRFSEQWQQLYQTIKNFDT